MRGCRFSISRSARVPHFRTPIMRHFGRVEKEKSNIFIRVMENTMRTKTRIRFRFGKSYWLQKILTWGSFRLVLGKWMRWGKTIAWLSKCCTWFVNIAILLFSGRVVAACEQKTWNQQYKKHRLRHKSCRQYYLDGVYGWVIKDVKCQE